MIYLSNFIEAEKQNIFKIGFKHFCPFDEQKGFNKSKEDLEKDGILLESLPDNLEYKDGFRQELFYNKTEHKVFYDYVKEDYQNLTPEQLKIKELEERISLMQKALDELAMGGN